VTVVQITAHTNHAPGCEEDKYLPNTKIVQEEIAIKVNDWIPSERIMEGEFSCGIFTK